MPIISIEHLKYKYPGMDRLVLDDISLSIEKGEFIGIIGKNGAGKSTLSQAIIGLVPQFYNGAYGGSVLVDGLCAESVPVGEMCEHVGLVFQNPFNQLSGAKDTVYGEVAFGLQNLGVEREEMKTRVERVLKQLDIWQYRDRNPFDLSGGQMQRVAIAGILVMQPDVMILDEPTSQLDPQGTEEVFRVVDELTKSGITIIMIEQKLEKRADDCDRLILMHEGKVVDFDTPERIFSTDDLEEMGVQPPAFTGICRLMEWKQPDGTYPATLPATLRVFDEHKSDINWKEKLESYQRSDHQQSDAQGSGTTPTANDASRNLFRVRDLGFSYTKEAEIFDCLNLELDDRATAIIGQNGAGKTTLVRWLKGLLKPVSGEIYFRDQDISGKTVAMLASDIGYVFQNPDDQIFKYHVLDEVMFGPLNIGMDVSRATETAKKALELMGLLGKEEENPYDLEMSERKMVAIASVLAMDTDVIILDEPIIAQDYEGKKRIGTMIRELSKNGKLVIAILHDMDFVAEYFERVLVMAHGRILADGNADEVFRQDEVLEEAKLQKPYMTQLYERLMIQ